MLNFLINWAGLFTTVFSVYLTWTALRVSRLSFIYTIRWIKFYRLQSGCSRLNFIVLAPVYFVTEFRNIFVDWFHGVHRVA